MISDSDRALIAASVAALRRLGWPSARALALVAAQLPPGPSRVELDRVGAALSRGETADAKDDLLAILGRGDAAGAEVLDECAAAWTAELEARRAARAAILYPVICFAGWGVVVAIVGFVAMPQIRAMLESQIGGYVPPATAFTFALYATGRWIGLALAALAIGASLFLPRALAGARELAAASRLRRYAAALRAKVAPDAALELVAGSAPSIFEAKTLSLDRYERALGAYAMAGSGPETAATIVAGELDSAGRRKIALMLRFLPCLLVFLLAIAVGPLIVAAYLPIFSLASGF